MVWISYVVIILLLYTPCLDWGKKIAEQTIDLNAIFPFLPFAIPPSYGGYILLFVHSLLLWGFVLLLLWFFEDSGVFRLFQRPSFRDGFLFALVPSFSNNIAFGLAAYIALPPGLGAFLKLVEAILVQTALREIALRAISFLMDLISLIPVPSDPAIIVLAIFTLVVAFTFKWEQKERYENIIMQNQLVRRQELREMIVPTPR